MVECIAPFSPVVIAAAIDTRPGAVGAVLVLDSTFGKALADSLV